jgi:hypothetical protein
MIAAASEIQSPLAVTLIGVLAAAMLTLAGAAVRLMVRIGQMQVQLTSILKEVSELKTDPDVMRWSNYGRAVQAFNMALPQPGNTQ